MGRDGERVPWPAYIAVPAISRPLERGRATSLECRTNQVVTELIAVITQDSCSLIAGRSERNVQPLQSLNALTLLAVANHRKV